MASTTRSIDPVFGVLADVVYRQAAAASALAPWLTAPRCARDEARANRTIAIAVGVGAAAASRSSAPIVVRFRRRLEAARAPRSTACRTSR